MAYVDHISIDGVQYDIRDAEAVSFEQEQTLNDVQQEQARANIGAGSEGDVSDLKSHVDDLEDAIGGPVLLQWAHTTGYYVHTNQTMQDPANPYTYSSGYNGKCLFMECAPGDEFIISLLGTSTNLRPWAFFRANGTIISKGDANEQYHDYTLVAPDEAAYVGFNSIATDAYSEISQGEYVFDEIKNELEAEINAVNVTAQEAISIAGGIEDTIGSTSDMAWDYTDAYYVDTRSTIDTASPYTYNAAYYGKCTFMSCTPGDVFVISLTGANYCRPYAFVDVSGNILEKGDNITYTNMRIVAPDNAAFVAFNLFGRNAQGNVVIGETIFQRYDAEINDIYNNIQPYSGKNCVAFGTSLTYRDSGYRPYLAKLLNMTIDNQGVGSAFWRTWGDDPSNILYNVQQYNGYADKNVCIIEGCVNDWIAGRTLGTYTDTGTDTVCGCLYNMITHVYSQNPNIQIVVILDHYGRLFNGNDTSSAAVNSAGKTQRDYYDECAKVCEFYGIACVKEYAISSIGIFGTQYLYDNIHLNDLGGQQSAMVIAKAMAQYGMKK